MKFELDHVFLATATPEEDEAALAKFGFRFTRRTVHRGQGTANVCAIFENAFFELLYAHDVTELRSDLVRPLGLAERIRWQETGACPVGICFRPAPGSPEGEPWPFATWGYEAAYLPPGVAVPIVTPRNSLTEPLVFLSLQPRGPGARRSSAERARGPSLSTLSGVKVGRPSGRSSCSRSVRWFEERGPISLQGGIEHLLELQFNLGAEHQRHRFPSHLPLAVCW